LIARLRGEGKLRSWNEDPEKWQRNKAEAVTVLHDGLSPEASAHRSQAFTEERRAARAEQWCALVTTSA
jgi:hypothetical protein